MNQQLHAIAQRIQTELPDMDRAIERARQALERAYVSSDDDLYLDSAPSTCMPSMGRRAALHPHRQRN